MEAQQYHVAKNRKDGCFKDNPWGGSYVVWYSDEGGRMRNWWRESLEGREYAVLVLLSFRQDIHITCVSYLFFIYTHKCIYIHIFYLQISRSSLPNYKCTFVISLCFVIWDMRFYNNLNSKWFILNCWQFRRIKCVRKIKKRKIFIILEFEH